MVVKSGIAPSSRRYSSREPRDEESQTSTNQDTQRYPTRFEPASLIGETAANDDHS
jgi:hypothetical protein